VAYYTLLVRDGDNRPWHVEFGDRDRDTVQVELDEMVHGYMPVPRRHARIIRTSTAHQWRINDAVAHLNHTARGASQ